MDNTTFITIPKHIYDRMCEENSKKQDIDIRYQLSIIDRDMYGYLHQYEVSCYSACVSLNSEIPIDYNKTSELIECAIREVNKKHLETINELQSEIEKYKQNWFVKLFL